MAIPTRIGPYSVSRELGRGGMGVVYLGHDTRLNRPVAIKAIPGELAKSPARLAAVEQEARILASMHHPNIAVVYSLEEENGHRYIILEYVPGDSLHDKLRPGPMPIPAALSVCLQIARAIVAAHEKGVIHRDLKPDNVKITPDGSVKVLDFGIAKSAWVETSGAPITLAPSDATAVLPVHSSGGGQIIGTPGYLSPEQARGQSVDRRCDLWALGCILFECLAGASAFQGRTISDLIRATLEEEPNWSLLPRGTPDRIRELLGRCLAKSVDQRPRTAADVCTELEAAIANKAPAGDGQRIGPTPTNLSRQLTSFIGREREIAQIKDLLASTSLLTMTGSGGCGKTRLALRIGSDLLDDYPDGVFVAELAPLTDPGLVPAAVATALGLKEERGRSMTESIIHRLRDHRTLLIVDNCEHLLPTCGALVESILRHCPRVTIIATSREALGVSGETTWRVPSLALPPARPAPSPIQTPTPGGSGPAPITRAAAAEALNYEAIRLFVERARAVKPGLEVTDARAEIITRICRRLDGIPLAIELAAARVVVLSAEQILDKLDDRFRLLTGGNRTALERHQTLRATIEWSVGLLSEPERRLLRALSVFAGGWTLAASESVCADGTSLRAEDILDLTTSLVSRSMVVADEAPDGQVRYRLLESIREFARSQATSLGEVEADRARHRTFFRTMAQQVESHMNGPEQAAWSKRADDDLDNLLTAIDSGLGAGESGGTDALETVGAMLPYFDFRGRYDLGRNIAERVLTETRGLAPSRERARALNTAGFMAWRQGDYKGSRKLHLKALEVRRTIGDSKGEAISLNNLGIVAMQQGQLDEAHDMYTQALEVRRAIGDRQGLAACLNNLGIVANDRRDHAAARRYYEEALELNRALGNRAWVAGNLNNLANTLRGAGELKKSLELHTEALAIRKELNDRRGLTSSYLNVAVVSHLLGDEERAIPLYLDGLRIQSEIGDRYGIASSLERVAWLASQRGHPTQAIRWIGASIRLREEMGAPMTPLDLEEFQTELDSIRRRLGEQKYEQGIIEGKGIGLPEAVAEVIAWLESAQAAPARRDTETLPG